MKFVTAHQSVEEFVAELENLIQSGAFHANNLLVVTLEEHASDLKSLVPVEIETVNEGDFNEKAPLNNHGLDDHSIELYDDILRRGGYVLLEKENPQKDLAESHSKKDEVELHAPGFGVDPDKPKSDDESHGDHLNPENTNPTSNR
ncbi:MAG: hypothetical protein JJU16_05675 [Alkalibacterium sp.]|nr:hypothetical protein [Alkalibacterium sp.]